MWKYIIVTVAVEKEGAYYVSKCLELGTASFGNDEEEAVANIIDATEAYLNTLEDLGECAQVLREKGITVRVGESASPKMAFPPGLAVRSAVFPLKDVAYV